MTRNDIKLLRAAQTGDIHAIKTLLDQGLSINLKNCAGMSPLHFAADAGRLDCVELLLSKGADVNVQTNIGLTPLMLAARNGYVDVVNLLINTGADVSMRTQINSNLESYSDCTALMLAKANGIILMLKQAETARAAC